jgi:SAM-dependent methyltransferase
MLSPEDERIEQDALRKYSGETYAAPTITMAPSKGDPQDFAGRLLQLKLDLVREHLGDPLMDLCCGNGLHTFETALGRSSAVGVDFSEQFVAFAAAEARKREIGNVAFVCANARSMPLATGSIGGIYSFSALYTIPDLESVLREIARVLAPGGRAVLDLGNSQSLNGFVCRHYYSELARHTTVPLAQTLAMCARAGLTVREHRSFQLLPLWADRPRYLKPLLHPFWTRLLARRIRGRMLDEWMSGLPGLRRFAFRHLLVCEKAA